MQVNRRSFCIHAVAGLLCGTASGSFGAVYGPDVDAFERARVLRQANGYLTAEPITVTASHSARSAGGLHDYFSEADDWWPDADHSDGPYIQQEGFLNPDNFNAHRDAMVRFSVMVAALTAAWKLTGQRRYAEAAAVHLRAWFLNPKTKMNPNLEYAQAIFGVSQGQGSGIIETMQLVEPVRAAALLFNSDVFTLKEYLGLQQWFSDYTMWMASSPNGMEERTAKDHHGSCWVMQVAEFARFTGNKDLTEYCRESFRTRLIPGQVAANGSLPLELAHRNPYGCSLFNLDVLFTTAQILSVYKDNLFTFALPDGRGLRKAMAYMAPFIKDKNIWPYPYDIAHFGELPMRQSSLLFAGLAYYNAEYFEIWKTLDAEPKVDEIVRGYPIRQPVLWV